MTEFEKGYQLGLEHGAKIAKAHALFWRKYPKLMQQAADEYGCYISFNSERQRLLRLLRNPVMTKKMSNPK